MHSNRKLAFSKRRESYSQKREKEKETLNGFWKFRQYDSSFEDSKDKRSATDLHNHSQMIASSNKKGPNLFVPSSVISDGMKLNVGLV